MIKIDFLNNELCLKKFGTLKKIIKSGIVAVIRHEDENIAFNCATSCLEGGILSVEVAMTTPGALNIIKKLTSTSKSDEITIGAGTVLDNETARSAILHGAEFIVSPGFNKETSKLCNRYQTPYIPGCMTINEIINATEYGSTIVKLFPGSNFEPEIIKAIKGPLPHVEIMPTGGINLKNIDEWIENGAIAVGVGGDLMKPAQGKGYKDIKQLAERYSYKLKGRLGS